MGLRESVSDSVGRERGGERSARSEDECRARGCTSNRGKEEGEGGTMAGGRGETFSRMRRSRCCEGRGGGGAVSGLTGSSASVAALRFPPSLLWAGEVAGSHRHCSDSLPFCGGDERMPPRGGDARMQTAGPDGDGVAPRRVRALGLPAAPGRLASTRVPRGKQRPVLRPPWQLGRFRATVLVM